MWPRFRAFVDRKLFTSIVRNLEHDFTACRHGSAHV